VSERPETLRAIYTALAAGDIETLRQNVTADVEIIERQEVPGASIYRGIDDWERGYEREGETIDEFRVELNDVEEIGGRCVADVVVVLRGRGSGAEVGERLAHLVDWDGDKVRRWRAFSDIEEARRIAREDEIKELYGLWDAGDLEGAMARVHPEIEWAEPEETIGARKGTGTEHAREGIRQWEESFDSYGGEVTGVESVGEYVLVEWVQRVRAGGSSVEMETPVMHLWGFRDGRAAQMRMYFERDQALDAAKSKPEPSA
jgi:ketosteroid isomerase-like protein